MSGCIQTWTFLKKLQPTLFYAKGSSSVDRLFEVLCAIKDEATCHSLRVAAPIWILGVPIERGCIVTIEVACQECLRTLAIVKPTADIDQTGFDIPARTVRNTVPAYIR
jgi:hypothetical protein